MEALFFHFVKLNEIGDRDSSDFIAIIDLFIAHLKSTLSYTLSRFNQNENPVTKIDWICSSVFPSIMNDLYTTMRYKSLIDIIRSFIDYFMTDRLCEYMLSISYEILIRYDLSMTRNIMYLLDIRNDWKTNNRRLDFSEIVGFNMYIYIEIFPRLFNGYRREGPIARFSEPFDYDSIDIEDIINRFDIYLRTARASHEQDDHFEIDANHKENMKILDHLFVATIPYIKSISVRKYKLAIIESYHNNSKLSYFLDKIRRDYRIDIDRRINSIVEIKNIFEINKKEKLILTLAEIYASEERFVRDEPFA